MSVLLIVRSEVHREKLLKVAEKVAQAKNTELYVLLVEEALPKNEAKEMEWQEVENRFESSIKSLNCTKVSLTVIDDLKPEMLILQDAESHSAGQKEGVNELMEEVSCEVMVIRMGSKPLDELGETGLGKIMVPSSGGRHSRLALRMATQLDSEQTTALFVEPDVDEVSESVGFAHLHRYIRRAGISLDDIRCHVELDNNPFKGIRREAERGAYGLIIIGASSHSSVRRKLFGTIPDKLLHGDSGVNIAVVRAATPIGDQFKVKLENLVNLSVPQLSREERVALFDEIEEKSRWSFDFAVLMILATSIAALGLLADSGAVVIGAMLVAPLMMPLLGGGLSLVQGNWPLWKRSQKAVILGFLSALGIGILMGLVAKFLGMPLTAQLAARGEPSTLDLGVAFISGIAASYCLARPKLSSALAGVAIAAALVPPIATTGICIALGDFAVAQGAALLFGTNVVAIVFGAAMNFYLAGIRGKKAADGVWSKRFLIVFALMMAGLVVPLTSALIGRIAGPQEVENVLIEKGEDLGVTIKRVRRGAYEDGLQVIELSVEAPAPLSQETLQILKSSIEAKLGEKVKIKVRTILVDQL